MYMNRILFTLSFAFVLSTFSIACDAQGWVKAGKAVSKQAAKALKSSKKTIPVRRQSQMQRSATRYNNTNMGRSAAVASQYTTIQCSTCSGKGWYVYNGYKYQCSSCSGYGYKVIRR